MDAMKNYEYKFEIKPGRDVYLPTDDCREFGKEVCRSVLDAWKPNECFFHLGKKTGHIGAMRLHKNSKFLAKRDFQNFFGSATRTKVHRALRSVGFNQTDAFDIAARSVVVGNDGRKFIPYGFVQSMCLATLALDESALGQLLKSRAEFNVKVSIYVDDVIISGNDRAEVDHFLTIFDEFANKSGWPIAIDKSVNTTDLIEIFNCRLAGASIEITEDRLQEFLRQYRGGSELSQNAIVHYVSAVNRNQGEWLERTA